MAHLLASVALQELLLVGAIFTIGGALLALVTLTFALTELTFALVAAFCLWTTTNESVTGKSKSHTLLLLLA